MSKRNVITFSKPLDRQNVVRTISAVSSQQSAVSSQQSAVSLGVLRTAKNSNKTNITYTMHGKSLRAFFIPPDNSPVFPENRSAKE